MKNYLNYDIKIIFIMITNHSHICKRHEKKRKFRWLIKGRKWGTYLHILYITAFIRVILLLFAVKEEVGHTTQK